jgi:hypothetical protein
MKDNLGVILGALAVLTVIPILLWVAREPSPPERKPDSPVHAAKTTVQGEESSVTLGWSANTEPSLAGYKIYYKTESKTPPYDGKGLTEGDSPVVLPIEKLENPKNPKFTLHGLNKDTTYFFSITAYDGTGKESSFSESVAFNSTKTN